MTARVVRPPRRNRWFRLLTQFLVAVLAGTLAPPILLPAVARAAGPSVELPEIKPVPATQQTYAKREQDEASRSALALDQGNREVDAGTGTPTATSLAPSATWNVSAQTGDFSWSYPLRVPPASGGLMPAVGLSYRSSTVDGRTSVTNNQPSWVGDGWDLWPGFIERTYGSCADDGFPLKGDLCWRSDNATAAYGTSAGNLICCDAGGEAGRWRMESDDGARIERLSGALNGDEGRTAKDTGEYWKITTVDGTQYFFGSRPEAGSTWTVPVFGDDTGEPCNGSSFDTSYCAQAWRWNLDTVIDRNGNMMRYFYDAEINKYGRNRNSTAIPYVRGGTLRRIEYGLHERVSATATATVEFGVADRCIPGLPCTFDNPGSWPDTPLNARCDGSTCTNYSPTFWSTKRLASITTNVQRDSTPVPVERWDLDQIYPDPGDGEKPALWLKAIRHTGLVGGEAKVPDVTFEGAQYPNRVYAVNDGYAALNRYRIRAIVSESGGITSVNYEPADCTSGNKPANAWTNTMRCFPVTWAPPNHEPRTDYFHKYVVASIIQSDAISSSPEQVTSYKYFDGAAWHWDDSEFVKDDKKTWSEFRGFGRVQVYTGRAVAEDPGGSPRTMTESRFYRGMAGDRFGPSGTQVRPTVTVSDSSGKGDAVRADNDWLQGYGFETTVYDGEDGPVVSRTVTHPAVRGPTATRGPFAAYIVRVGTQWQYTALASGGWRESRATTSFDDRGLPLKVDDSGDLAVSGDSLCTTTEYARNLDRWMLDRPSRVEQVAVDCDVTPGFPDHAVSDGRFVYDARGNLLQTLAAKERPTSGPVHVVTATADYDEHGRVTATRDALGHGNRIAYTPALGGPVTGTTVTTPTTPTLPAGLVTTTTLEPAWGLPVLNVDPNGRRSEVAYDPLGRAIKEWFPNRPASGDEGQPQGSVEYSYLIRRDAPTAVTTTRIGPNGVAVRSTALLDGLLRTRQVQQAGVGMHRTSPDGPEVPFDEGRLIVDTRYDTHGRPYKTTQPYYNTGAVDNSLWVASDTEIPGLTLTRYDGAGRAVAEIFQAGATERWRSTVTYGGDRVSTVPPAGGTPTTVISDIDGRTTELRQFHGSDLTGASDTTKYSYTATGRLAEVVGPDGARWRYRYDLRGRQVGADDPDAGTTTMTYDDASRLLSSRDARGVTIGYAYDDLNRRTATFENGRGDQPLTRWTYDTAGKGLGLPASATQYVGAARDAYTSTVESYSALNKPLKTSVMLPAVDGALPNTYSTTFTYGTDGTLTSERYPAIGDPTSGGLGEETVNYQFDDWGRPTSTGTPSDRFVASTFYNRYGEMERLEHGGTVGSRLWQTFLYDTNTRRLVRSVIDAEVARPIQNDLHYTYDPAGNVTSIADLTSSRTPDVQCMRYDGLRRLTDAWTPTKTDRPEDRCTAAPSKGNLAGPAPYWHTYTYDAGGNRRTETQHTSLTSTTRIYGYPAGRVQPHTLQSVAGPGGTETFAYDPTGRTTRRVKPGADETYTWNSEGRLDAVRNTTTGKLTSFVYTADGNRLLRRDPDGTTLYLGNQEVRVAAGSSRPVVTRYYAHGGRTVAMRRGGSGLVWLAADHQGTGQVAVDTATKTATRRTQFPFGAPRESTGTWPTERGFVGGTTDASTGLTHLGAREYDPATGRFISVDPVMDLTSPQQMHGYAYANNSPVTFSDPSGLAPCSGPDGVGCGLDKKTQNFCGGPFCGPQGQQVASGAGAGGSGDPAPTVVKLKHGSTYTKVHRAQRIFEFVDDIWIDPDNVRDPFLFAEQYDQFYATSNITDPYLKTMSALSGACQTRESNCTMALARMLGAGFGEYVSANDPNCGPTCQAFSGHLTDIAESGSTEGRFGGGPKVLMAGRNNLLKGLSGGCSGNSFEAGTRVLEADGTTVPIEDLEPGDLVLATDPETGRTAARAVTVTIAGQGVKNLVTLSLTGPGAGPDQLVATSEHPFWVEAKKAWLDAEDLQVGDVLTGPNGEAVTVTATTRSVRVQRVFNLTVDDLHTYYVLAGNTPILVHNEGGDDYNQAMNKALAWLDERGFVAERTTIGKFGTIAGQPIGSQTADGKTGFRVEFDKTNGAHINVWSGKEKGPHFKFDASERTVTKIQGNFGCK